MDSRLCYCEETESHSRDRQAISVIPVDGCQVNKLCKNVLSTLCEKQGVNISMELNIYSLKYDSKSYNYVTIYL